MSSRTNVPGAFTLLELLVVIAVTGLLLAILLPALSAASEAGRAAFCGTNLNQLSHGSFAYSEDHDDRLPFYAYMGLRFAPGGDPDPVQWWVTQIASGMDQFEPEIFRCPSDPTPNVGPEGHIPVYLRNGMVYMADRAEPRGSFIRMNISYRGSCDLTEETVRIEPTDAGPVRQTLTRSRRITSWRRPHLAIELIEGIPQYTANPAVTQMECYRFRNHLLPLIRGKAGLAGNPPHRMYDSFERHLGTSNVLFLDGHVARHIPPELGQMSKYQEFIE